MSEKKKFALVTGGSRGIGKAICLQLALDTEYKILINYKENASAAQETLNEIEKNGGSAELIQFNVVSGLKGTPGQVNYSAAKGGIIAGTKALAQEIAKRNITVNAVAPGFIKTDMTGDLDEKELKKMIPMNRFGEAGEVAHLVSFLASKKSSYITGEVININGGIYS